MTKVTAYLCDDTGQLFLHESDFKKHRRKFLSDKRKKDIITDTKTKLESYFDNIRKHIKSFDDLAAYIEANYFNMLEMLVEADKKGVSLDFSFDGSRVKSIFKDSLKHRLSPDVLIPAVTFEHRHIVFNPSASKNSALSGFEISNSHNCPENGVTNWGGRVEGAPRGYPGVNLRFKMEFPKAKGECLEDGISIIFKYLRIHRGTGGGTSDYQYGDLEMFSDEWPFITKAQFAYSLSCGRKGLYAEIKDLVSRDLNISEPLASDLFLLIEQQASSSAEAFEYAKFISAYFEDVQFQSKIKQLLVLPPRSGLFKNICSHVFSSAETAVNTDNLFELQY